MATSPEDLGSSGGCRPFWVALAWAATPSGPTQNDDPHMLLDVQPLPKTPQFRSYWIQRNVTATRQYRAAVVDLYRGAYLIARGAHPAIAAGRRGEPGAIRSGLAGGAVAATRECTGRWRIRERRFSERIARRGAGSGICGGGERHGKPQGADDGVARGIVWRFHYGSTHRSESCTAASPVPGRSAQYERCFSANGLPPIS